MDTATLLRCFIIAVLTGGFAAACGDDDEAPENQHPEQNQTSNHDGQNQGIAENDEVIDFDDDCHRAAHGASDFEVAPPEGFEQTYYARATRAGDELWVSFVSVVEQGVSERAFLVRLECDGEPIEDPMQLGDETVEMEAGGPIVADDSVVYVVWRQEGPEQIETRLRTFDLDGTPRQDDPVAVEAHVEEEETPLVLDYADIVIDHQGNAAVAAEAIIDEHVYVLIQRIDPQGVPVGPAFFVDDGFEDHQVEPVVERLDTNHLVYAFLEVPVFGAGSVYHGTVRPDGESSDQGPTAAEASIGGGNLSETIRLSTHPSGGSTWMTYQRGTEGDNTVVIREAAQLGPAVGEKTTRIPGRTSSFPDVAASEEGGAIAWISGSPLSGRIHFQRFSGAGIEVLETGPVVDQHDEDRVSVPFGPDLVWLYDEVYAAVWSERNGDYRVHGTIVDLGENEDEDQ